MVAQQPAMSCARLERELCTHLPALTGGGGVWQSSVDGIDIFILADDRADRVRIMTPIARADRHDDALHVVLLSANFDRALDAHYAVHDEIVWCLFVAALSDLTPERIGRAVNGVLTLARNTGSTFASGEERFTGTLGTGGIP